MTIVNQKPSYRITVRDNFWNFLVREDGAARMYEKEIYRSPVVKSIDLKGTVVEGRIYASGLVYDYTRQVQGAEITLDAVALEHLLVDKAIGAHVDGGFVYDKSNDISKEFAFGYYLEQRDGSYVYYWHPRCLLTQSDDKAETSNDSAPNPSTSYTIQVLPTTEGVWRVRYFTQDVDSPLSPEEFFAFARYTESVQAVGLTLSDDVSVGSVVAATIEYADGQAPASPTVAYSWWIADSADGTYSQIDGETSSSYTPSMYDEGKYVKCAALVSDTALGYVESEPREVAAV